MNALVAEYPHDWNQMPDIERRRLINMYLNSIALHHYGLSISIHVCWCSLLPRASHANDFVTRVSSHTHVSDTVGAGSCVGVTGNCGRGGDAVHGCVGTRGKERDSFREER